MYRHNESIADFQVQGEPTTSVAGSWNLRRLVLAGAALLVLSANQTRADSALSFDGIDDRVTVPYDDSFPTEVFTVSAWIKSVPPSRSRGAIIARGEDDDSWNLSWHMYILSNGTLGIMLEDNRERNYQYPSEGCDTEDLHVADDTWHHVAATRNSEGTLLLYIDGQPRMTCLSTGTPSSNNYQDLTFGCTHGYIGPPPGGEEPPTWFFPGWIDEPAMWSVALTEQEMEDVFLHGVDPSDAGLEGYWDFNEGSGQMVADLSGTGNHGFRGATAGEDDADPEWVIRSVDGDSDGDGDVDLDDHAAFVDCMRGPDREIDPECDFADFDSDDDADLVDFSAFILLFEGT